MCKFFYGNTNNNSDAFLFVIYKFYFTHDKLILSHWVSPLLLCKICILIRSSLTEMVLVRYLSIVLTVLMIMSELPLNLICFWIFALLPKRQPNIILIHLFLSLNFGWEILAAVVIHLVSDRIRSFNPYLQICCHIVNRSSSPVAREMDYQLHLIVHFPHTSSKRLNSCVHFYYCLSPLMGHGSLLDMTKICVVFIFCQRN